MRPGESTHMARPRHEWCIGNDTLLRTVSQRLHGILLYVIMLSKAHCFLGLTTAVNSSRDPVRVRDDGDRFVKLKGLSIPLLSQKSNLQRHNSVDKSKSPKLKPEKRITGARIEFTTDMDKRLFLEKFREVQGTFFAGER